MSSLIVTIIAVALVAIAALAAVYYGSTSWDQGQTKAKAITLVNQREQIKTAAAVYKSDKNKGTPATGIQQLIDESLLATAPQLDGVEWKIQYDKVYLEFPSDISQEEIEEICSEAYALEHEGEAMHEIRDCGEVEVDISDDICCKQ